MAIRITLDRHPVRMTRLRRLAKTQMWRFQAKKRIEVHSCRVRMLTMTLKLADCR